MIGVIFRLRFSVRVVAICNKLNTHQFASIVIFATADLRNGGPEPMERFPGALFCWTRCRVVVTEVGEGRDDVAANGEEKRVEQSI